MVKLRGARIEVLMTDEATFNIDFFTMYPLYFKMSNGIVCTILKSEPKTDWQELVEMIEC